MGCSSSKLDNEEAVQLCKDRKTFIKQAVEQRLRFASGHMAYIQSLKRVSAALRNYVEGDEPREFSLNSFTTPPTKRSNPVLSSISSKIFSEIQFRAENDPNFKVNYLRSGGNPAVVVEERPPDSPETVRIKSYSPIHHYGIDGFFSMNSSFYPSTSSPNNQSSFPPATPPRNNSRWDFFWNPFTSLDTYGYPTRSSLDHSIMDDDEEDIIGLRKVREKEGIPNLEEDTTSPREVPRKVQERFKIDVNCAHENCCTHEDVIVESDVDTTDSAHEVHQLEEQRKESVDIVKRKSFVEVEVNRNETSVTDGGTKEETTPDFTVYVNRRPTSMAEVVKDIETQFMLVCDSAKEISSMLEANRAQYISSSNELSASKRLNPIALFRSTSSRSSSSRFFPNSSCPRDDICDTSSEFSEESCMFSGSHQSTLDRLYAWEKKLYMEVKSGERIRIAYEKKLAHLRNQDIKGDDPSSIDKTRAAIRDLHTQIKVSIHSVESVSKRIETLRDEELHPQLVELIQGLSRMWKVMADCHQYQKCTIEEAKFLLAGTPSKLSRRRNSDILPIDPLRLAESAANLETELRNWKASFKYWITSQRSYVHALSGWLLRCIQYDSTDTKLLPFSPRRNSMGAPPIFSICIQWCRFFDGIVEVPVIDGLDFFASGMGSLYSQQMKEDSRSSRRLSGGGSSHRFGESRKLDSRRFNMDMVEVGGGEVEDVMTAEKTAEVAVKVLCAGMSVTVSSLTEFALISSEGYNELVKQWENSSRMLGTERLTGL